MSKRVKRLNLYRSGAEICFDSLHQGFRAERFGDIAGGAGHASADLIKESILSGDHHDGHVFGRVFAADHLANLIAVHPGHRDVEKNEVGNDVVQLLSVLRLPASDSLNRRRQSRPLLNFAPA